MGLPSWREGVPTLVPLAASVAAMPAHAWFWWLVLAGTVMGGLFLLSAPLEAKSLMVFLHAVAGVVALYAVMSIAAAHTAWSWPFAGGANFGFLPNRNHTATLLVVGSIISFGLMQWEVARGYRAAAVVSALCGAPSLAALLFFSTSRAGVIFLAVGFVVWGIGAAGTAIKRRTALGAAGVLAVFLLLLFVLGGSTVRDRLGALWQDALVMESGDGTGREVDFRQPVFRDTWTMVEDAPLTGQGLGHFEFVFPHYRQASLRAARVLHPESDWLMVAAESGVPAVVVLLLLVGWYFARCWRARTDEDGLLRWTVASAIGATLLHGIIDVPWHRPALGWFLLVVALAALLSGGRTLQRPRIWRVVQVACGLALLGFGGFIGWSGMEGRPPVVYRWDVYHEELGKLAAARKHDDGEFVAREAIRDFPLQYQAHYWHVGFLRAFEGTEGEMEEGVAAGRFVEPVLPVVAGEQANLWVGIDDRLEAESRVEAARRARIIEEKSGIKGAAAAEVEKGLRAAQHRPALQAALREQLQGETVFLAYWVRSANAELVEEYLSGLGPAAWAWLDALPPELREQVLSRWITLPSAAGAVEYMERSGGAQVYGRQLADFHAKAGDKERAVRIVAEVEGVDLGGACWMG
jgi:O-antigen ligase